MTQKETLSLSNESQYLLISRPSVKDLLSKIKERQSNENEAIEHIGINFCLFLVFYSLLENFSLISQGDITKTTKFTQMLCTRDY